MTKNDFIKAMAEKTGTTHVAAAQLLEAMIATLAEVITNKDSVSLPGLGTFSTKQRAERQGRNPSTGQTMVIPAATLPHFKISPQLKLLANQ